MLQFFRRFINSRMGMVVTFGVLGVVALAFAAGDVTGLGSSGGGILGRPAVSVGGQSMSSADLARRMQDELRMARQQQPTVDMAQLVQQGAVEAIVRRAITSMALDEFGKDQGLRVSRALVGSELRNIAAFRGPTGQFDQKAYERLIAQRGMTDSQVQGEIAKEIMSQFLLVPTVGASQVPQGLAMPYASLLLERRSGQVALIPAAAVPAPAAPSDGDVQQWYRQHLARYTTPERRVIRYIVVHPDTVKAQATPTEAEIAAAYRAAADTYAAKEMRSVTLVTVLDQKAAEALAAKVKGGTAIDAAARAAGLEPRVVTDVDKAALAGQTSPALADQVFAAARGAVVGPVKGGFGFVVARVDGTKQRAGRTLADVHGEIAATLTKQKTNDALQKMQGAIDDSLTDNANIGEVAADQKLTVQATPALTAAGLNPDQPGAQPDPALAKVVAAGFAAEEGDAPTTVGLGDDGSFAVVALDRIVRPTPVPLDKARGQVIADLQADRVRRAARDAASKALAALNKGQPLAAVLSASGLKLPPPQPLAAVRAQLNADPRGVNPVLALLFSMKRGTAKMLESPENKGWLLIQLDQVTPGDATKQPGAVTATRGDLGRVIGNEYAEQFARAVGNLMGAKRNQGAIDQVKKDLLGGGAGNQ